MAQIISDVAPGTGLSFHTAFGGLAGFAQGILDLADAGADVIVDDVLYFAEPMFGDGVIAQAVDEVAAAGVAYFSSAGNSASVSYEAPFRASGIQGLSTGSVLHDFDPGPGVDVLQTLTIPAGGTATFSLQWNDEYLTTGGPGAITDFDFVFYDLSAVTLPLCGPLTTVCQSVDLAINPGQDPVEIGSVTNNSAVPVTVQLGIEIFQPPANAEAYRLKYVYFPRTAATVEEYATNSSTSYGHANAAGAIALGAAWYINTPSFGVDPAVAEVFSSRGGLPVAAPNSGSPLPLPPPRAKPELTAADGGDTTFFSPGSSDPDGTGFPNFFGTSASAPHAAAVAALMLEQEPTLNLATLTATLIETARDMDDPADGPAFSTGFDFLTGAGLLDAFEALTALEADGPAGETLGFAVDAAGRPLLPGELALGANDGPISSLNGSLFRAEPVSAAASGTFKGRYLRVEATSDPAVEVQLAGADRVALRFGSESGAVIVELYGVGGQLLATENLTAATPATLAGQPVLTGQVTLDLGVALDRIVIRAPGSSALYVDEFVIVRGTPLTPRAPVPTPLLALLLLAAGLVLATGGGPRGLSRDERSAQA